MFVEIEEKPAILVADPDPLLYRTLHAMFNTGEWAYRIDVCETQSQAVEKIESNFRQNKAYVLLFTEAQLIDGSGLQLISRLWRIDPDLHVVLCTAGSNLTWEAILEEVGESDQLLILPKPLDSLILRQTVHAMMRKWQLSKQSRHVMAYMERQIQERTQAIEIANKNLLQSEKLAAVGQLAAGIAHEINTPAQYVGDNLRAIQDFFGSLIRFIEHYRQSSAAPDPAAHLEALMELEKQEDLAFILEDAPLAIKQSLDGMDQIVRIVQAMKGFAHSGRSQASTVDINLALESTLLIARNSYKTIADIETRFADISPIECYPGELNQVFLNIVVNAAHAIEESGKGWGKITIETAGTETGIEIRIRDTGKGIPENLRHRIFEPFFSTKDVGKGTGQGLSIAYRIIKEQHGGTLTFESEPGGGTTFIIGLNRRLPQREPNAS